MRTAVLVTGSRSWTDEVAVADRLRRYPRGTILIHGWAQGADRIAHELGRARSFVTWPLSYFSDLGKAGGHARNRAMIAVLVTLKEHGFAVHVEAFHRGASPGTAGCIAAAKAAGLDTHVTKAT